MELWELIVEDRSGRRGVVSDVIVWVLPGGGAAPKMFEKAASL